MNRSDPTSASVVYSLMDLLLAFCLFMVLQVLHCKTQCSSLKSNLEKAILTGDAKASKVDGDAVSDDSVRLFHVHLVP